MPITRETFPGGERVRHIGGSGGIFKGGGGGGSAPVDDPNTLRSTARARMLLCLGEGPVEGFTQPSLQQSVRLDGTPLQSPNGTLNFQGFSLDWRNGTTDQPYIPGFDRAAIEEPVNTLVRNSLPVTRTIFDPTVNAARVRIRLPSLRNFTEKGSKTATTQYLIEYAPAGGGYQRVVDQTIADKADSAYERSHEFVLQGSAPWDIRVVRPIPDSNDAKLENSVIFQALTSVQYEQQRYPDTVLLSVDIDAQQFNSIPTISTLLRGLRVLIPHNYDPYTRTYNGPFNGTLVPGWTNNPAWILYDILTDTRYGARVRPALVDTYDFYAAALHCDELVSNGEGGQEPRWKFNATIETREESFKLAEAIASSFNGKLIPRGSRIGLIVDKLQKPVRNYGLHNVEVKRDESGNATSDPFEYKSVSTKTISTVAIVSYREPKENWEVKQIYVEDKEGIARYGYRPTDVTAFGCDSRTQARRIGLRKLLTDRLQWRLVSFRVATEGMLVNPGEVIGITDAGMSGLRLSGRISDVPMIDELRLDAAQLFSVREKYTLLTTGADGKLQENEIDLVRTGTQEPTRDIFLADEFATPPPAGGSWAIRSSSIQPILFQVSAVTESEDGGYEIEALQYASDKYNAIDNGGTVTEIRTTNLPDPLARPLRPENLVINDFITLNDAGELASTINLGWGYPESGYLQLAYFDVEYQLEGDTAWTRIGTTKSRTITVQNLAINSYVFRVTGVNTLGLRGLSVSGTVNLVASLGNPPQAVQNLRLSKTGDKDVILRWNYVDEGDVRKGGFHIVKHSPRIAGVTWKDGSEVARLPGYRNEVILPFQEGTYQIRTFDSSGNPSDAIASISTTFSLRNPYNVIKIFQESPEFFGTVDRVAVAGNYLQLALVDENSFASEGYYYFSDLLILDAPYPVYLYSVVDASVFARTDAIDLQPPPFDALPSTYFDGDDIDNPDFIGSPSATIQVSLSLDGVNYSPWTDLIPGEYLMKNAQFRLRMETEDAGLTVEVGELQIIADVPDRVESGRLITSISGPTLVNYSSPFIETPQPQLSALNQQVGDILTILSESNQVLSFEVRNGGALVAREFIWSVRGFGKQV